MTLQMEESAMRMTKRNLWISVAATLMAGTIFAVSAQAHGPTRRKIMESIEIDASADKVWAVLGNVKDWNWVQNVTKTDATGDDPGKSKRTLTLANGHTITDEVTSYKPDQKMLGYFVDKIDIKDLPANDYSANITIEPEGDAKSKVEWKAAFYRGYMNNDPPPELNDEASEKAVRAWVRASLENLKAKVEKSGS